MRAQCDFELGKWTVRLNGIFVVDFWRRGKAYEVALRLNEALSSDEASAVTPDRTEADAGKVAR